MKIHRVHHRRGRYLHAGHRLIRTVSHGKLDAIAHARTHDRSGNLIAERPGTELHAGSDLDDLMGGVNMDLFTASAASGLTAASMLSELPVANAPVWRSFVS